MNWLLVAWLFGSELLLVASTVKHHHIHTSLRIIAMAHLLQPGHRVHLHSPSSGHNLRLAEDGHVDGRGERGELDF